MILEGKERKRERKKGKKIRNEGVRRKEKREKKKFRGVFFCHFP